MAKTNEAFSKNLSMLQIVNLKESILDLLNKESKYVPVASICKSYLNKLDEGMHEAALCADYASELSKVATHDSAKESLYTINSKIDEHKRDISIVNYLLEMKGNQYSYIVPMIESVLVDYMSNKTTETRAAARQTLSLFEGIKEINNIFESLSFDEYEEKTGKQLINSSLNEALLPKKEKTYTKEEVDTLVSEAKVQAVEESKQTIKKNIKDIDTHIQLDNTIKNILKDCNNDGLKSFCEQYVIALNNGKSEETLYESFISGISSWNYLNAVDTNISALKDRVSKYQLDIDLKKILETMKLTGSYYIVPLIENVVADYMDNKSMSTKAVLKQRLQAFEYDPFVRDILNVVMYDQSIANSVYLGESVEKLNKYVHTEKVFSPIQYIKENECIFNVKGTYYNRKGNTITKLSKSSITNLSESFKTLCNLVNHPAVKIDDLTNTISIYEGKDHAVISETSIEINNTPISESELINVANTSHLMNEHKEGFYAAIKMINENFDKIAYIDFVKRVAMNESNGKTVDVFRVKNNLFVTTIDESLGTSTFYRNVNPIACRTYINEHMQINVSNLFEDILPNQHAVLEGIKETDKEYQDTIDELKKREEEFKALKDESDDVKEIDDALDLIKKEIEDLESKYDEFKKSSDKFINGDDDDASTENPDDIATNLGDDDIDNNNEPKETEDQMQEPISEPTGEDVFVDPNQAAIDSATPYDADFDVVAGNSSKADVKVLRISYSENVKTGKKSNNGTAYIVIPSVDANGDIKDETKTVTFYLDADRKPIINNDYMPLMIYNSIVNAIAEDPDTAGIEVNGTAEQGDVPADTTAPILPATDDTLASTDIPTEPVMPADSVNTTDNVSTEQPVDSEEMFGLDANPDIPVDDVINNVDTNNDENISTNSADSELPTEQSINQTLDQNSEDSNAASEPGESAPIVPATQETPAETASKDNTATYPIELGLNTLDIKPINRTSFTDALDDMGIEHSEVEGDTDSVTLKFANKAAVYALKDYFKEWKNFSDTEFINFFPELKKCFNNTSSTVPVAANESVSIVGVKSLNESKIFTKNNKNGVTKVVLPYNKDYAKMFGHSTDKKTSYIEIVTENFDESKNLYRILNTYSAIKGEALDEEAKTFLKRYEKDFADIKESNVFVLDVPYNAFLEQKLTTKGISTNHIDESLRIGVDNTTTNKAKKILESFYGENTPVDVKDFFQLAESSLNEGLKIRIEDTNTGKVVELDGLDSLDSALNNSKDDSSAEGTSSDPFKDVNTTFKSDENALIAGDDDSADKDEKDENTEEKKEEKSEESTDNKNSEEKTENSSEEEEKKDEPKKFKFRVKKHKINSTDESLKSKSSEVLNESTSKVSLTPNVLDWVKTKYGVGQIIATLPMSNNFIVNVDGHTIECEPKSLDLVSIKKDEVEVPYKFDPATLKGLFEQMVHCGLFMNNNQITPSDCYTKYSEYINAKDEDDIRLVVEGSQVFAKKKYIKICESINDFANVNEYVDGVEITDTGIELRSILMNIKDYNEARGASDPVRVLIADDKGEKHLTHIPMASVKPIKM